MSKKNVNKEGFDDLIYEEVIKARSLDTKPKMLLHVCCAICASHVLNLISKEFDITIFYYNPNIHPKEEYEKRLNEVKRLVKVLGLEDNVKIVAGEYEVESYYDACSKYKDEKEGSIRCTECFYLRLKKTALYAKENNFDMFATTLTISPHKNSKVINQIGEDIEKELGIHFAKSDFKKREGFKKANELCNKYDIYRQNYCGCSYSLKEALEFQEKIKDLENN